jgi:hypothetical protein
MKGVWSVVSYAVPGSRVGTVPISPRMKAVHEWFEASPANKVSTWSAKVTS